jgi:soluble lytic murein transglycosylase
LIVSSKGYVPYALASYNAGPGNLFRWSKLRPGVQDLRKGFDVKTYGAFDEIWVEELPWSETRFYVKAVLRNFGLYRLLSDQSGGFSCDFYWICT